MLKHKSIFEMFARSPVRPLQQHMHRVQACVELLMPFYAAIRKNEWTTCQKFYEEISVIEQEADALKCDLRLHMPKSLFLPVPRSDLLGLLSNQDVLANKAKDIAGIMLGRKMVIPEQLDQRFKAFLQRSVDACTQATKAVDELDELLESGFRGKEVAYVEEMLVELNLIEHETDEMQIELRQVLFGLEQSLKPVDVMFLYKIIEWIGCLANKAQQAGYQLQLLLAD